RHHSPPLPALHPFPTRRSSDLFASSIARCRSFVSRAAPIGANGCRREKRNAGCLCRLESFHHRAARLDERFHGLIIFQTSQSFRSEEHTSELQSRFDLVCRLLL